MRCFPEGWVFDEYGIFMERQMHVFDMGVSPTLGIFRFCLARMLLQVAHKKSPQPILDLNGVHVISRWCTVIRSVTNN